VIVAATRRSTTTPAAVYEEFVAVCGDSSSKLYISPIDPSAFPLTPERNPTPRLGPMSISAHAHAPTNTNTQERARERGAVARGSRAPARVGGLSRRWEVFSSLRRRSWSSAAASVLLRSRSLAAHRSLRSSLSLLNYNILRK